MIKHKVREKRDNGMRPEAQPIWLEEKDEALITEVVARIVKEDRLNVLAYNICGDHMHLLLVCEEEEVPRIMQKIKSVSAKEYNRATGKTTAPETTTREQAPLSRKDSANSENDTTTRQRTALSEEDSASTDITREPTPLSAKDIGGSDTDTIATRQHAALSEPDKEPHVSLWTQKFGCKPVTTNEQLANTIEYIEYNREKHQLPPMDKGACSLVKEMCCDHDHAFRIEYKGGFDVVVGNPPYVVTISLVESDYFRNNYETTQGKKYDLFRFFIERGLRLLAHNSKLGFITPDVFLNLKQASELRKYILTNYSITQVIKAPLDTFAASVESVMFIIEKPKIKNSKIFLKKVFTNEVLSSVEQESLLQGDNNIDLSVEFNSKVVEKINSKGIQLSKLMIWKKGLGVYSRQHLANKFTSDEVEKIMTTRPWTKDYKANETFGKEILGKDVLRYCLVWNEIKWLSYGPWLAFQRPIEFFKGPRLLVREITTEGRYCVNATYAEEEYFNNQSIFNGILKQENNEFSLKYFLALINSKLFSYYVLVTSPKFKRKLFPTILMENIEQFPVLINIDAKYKYELVCQVDSAMDASSSFGNIQSQFLTLLQSKFDFYKGAGATTREHAPLSNTTTNAPLSNTTTDAPLSTREYTPLSKTSNNTPLPKASSNTPLPGKAVSRKLQEWYLLDFKEFLKELQKAKVKMSLSEEAEWLTYLSEQKQKALALKDEIEKTDKEIDRMVYSLYDLTDQEIAIVENN
ncbi:MAG: transposase [Bacteroidetes bacterium]|nr:transposase [Bacteroidota bacterium]